MRAAQHAKGKIWPEIPIILLVSTSSRRAVIHSHPPTPTRPQSKHDAGRRLHHPRHLWRDQGGPPGALVISSLRAPAGSAACWLRNALAMPAISLPYPEPEPSVREAGKTLPTVSAFTRSQVTVTVAVTVTLVAPPPSPPPCVDVCRARARSPVPLSSELAGLLLPCALLPGRKLMRLQHSTALHCAAGSTALTAPSGWAPSLRALCPHTSRVRGGV